MLRPNQGSTDPGSCLPPSNQQTHTANESTTDPQLSSQASAVFPSTSDMGSPVSMGHVPSGNQFDDAFLEYQQQDLALQDPESTNLQTDASTSISSDPEFYAGRDGLQAYLIRQQLCAGIPVDQIEPMSGPGSGQMQPPLSEVQSGGPGPVLIDVNNSGAFVPAIPPAQFHGILHPLPIHPWFPNPRGYYRAQAMNGASEIGSTNISNGQSQSTMATNDRELQPELSALLTNGYHATDNLEDTRFQQPVSETTAVDYSYDLGPANNHSGQSAPHAQSDGGINMVDPSLAPGPSRFPVNNMTSASNNAFVQPMVGTHGHSSNSQPMTENSAHPGNGQPMIANNPPNRIQSSSANGSSINREYEQLMTSNTHASGSQGLSNTTNDHHSSLLTPGNHSITNPLSQGSSPSMANTSTIPSQTFDNDNHDVNGLSLTNDAMAPSDVYQPMLGNNQIDMTRFTTGTAHGNSLSTETQSMLDVFNQLCSPAIPNEYAAQVNTSNDLSSFFDNEEEQRIVTEFYANHFCR